MPAATLDFCAVCVTFCKNVETIFGGRSGWWPLRRGGVHTFAQTLLARSRWLVPWWSASLDAPALSRPHCVARQSQSRAPLCCGRPGTSGSSRGDSQSSFSLPRKHLTKESAAASACQVAGPWWPDEGYPQSPDEGCPQSPKRRDAARHAFAFHFCASSNERLHHGCSRRLPRTNVLTQVSPTTYPLPVAARIHQLGMRHSSPLLHPCHPQGRRGPAAGLGTRAACLCGAQSSSTAGSPTSSPGGTTWQRRQTCADEHKRGPVNTDATAVT